MAQDLGIEPSEDRLQNNAAYIQSWKDEIKENPNALFTAIADADKIARYVSSKEQAYRQTKDVEYYAIVEETNAYSEQVYRCYIGGYGTGVLCRFYGTSHLRENHDGRIYQEPV